MAVLGTTSSGPSYSSGSSRTCPTRPGPRSDWRRCWGGRGRPAEALAQARSALLAYRAAGHRAGEAEALNGVGWYHTQLGDHRQALGLCEQALAILQEVGDPRAQAATQDTIGLAHHHLGDHRRATTCYRQALALYQELGELFYEADTLIHLSDACLAGGDLDAGRDALGRAQSILSGFNHPDAVELGDRAAALGRAGVAKCHRRLGGTHTAGVLAAEPTDTVSTKKDEAIG